jgi:hypothetical protein
MPIYTDFDANYVQPLTPQRNSANVDTGFDVFSSIGDFFGNTLEAVKTGAEKYLEFRLTQDQLDIQKEQLKQQQLGTVTVPVGSPTGTGFSLGRVGIGSNVLIIGALVLGGLLLLRKA